MLSVSFYLATLERGWVWRAERKGVEKGLFSVDSQVMLGDHRDTSAKCCVWGHW